MQQKKLKAGAIGASKFTLMEHYKWLNLHYRTGNRRIRHLILTVNPGESAGSTLICIALEKLQNWMNQLSYMRYAGRGDVKHVHLLTVSPFLSQSTWSDLWRLCSGFRVVFINSIKIEDIGKLIEYIDNHPSEIMSNVFNNKNMDGKV